MFKALTDTRHRPARHATTDHPRAVVRARRSDAAEVDGGGRRIPPAEPFLPDPPAEPSSPETVIDISHESLMRIWKRLRPGRIEEAESARMYRRIHDTAMLHAAGKAGLWRDPDIQFALDWRSREQPTAQWADLYGGNLSAALSFIDESKWMADRAAAEIELQRRWNRWFVVPGSLMLLALYVVLLNVVSDSEALNFLPWLFRYFIEPTLPALPVVLVGLGLTYAGETRAPRAGVPRL